MIDGEDRWWRRLTARLDRLGEDPWWPRLVRRLARLGEGEGPWWRRRRLLATLGALALGIVGVVVALVVATGGKGGDPFPTLEAGSRFGDPRGQVAGGRSEERDEGERARRAPNLSDARIGQAVAGLFLVGFAGEAPTASFFERLQRREWGAILVDANNYVDEAQMTALIAQARNVAALRGGRAPVVVAPQPGGEASAFPDLPPAEPREVGGEGAQAVRSTTSAAARALADLGIDAVLAPRADISVVGGAAEDLVYGESADVVTRSVRAAVAAWRGGGVAPVVGRFPGEGAASQDPELGPATVGLSLDQLRQADLRPFAAVAAGAAGVQLSNALYADIDPVTPATLVPQVVRLARKEVGFRGPVVSADLVATTAVGGGDVGSVAVQALQAGCDVLFVPGGQAEQEAAYRAVVRAVRTGKVSADRVRQALERARTLRRRGT
ncbi:MAG TPA: glycoside hydrolase family 3 N-terminal domain-containing protein [Solirubrobacteraceae bacterium]|nr:glycoside hydrolase family 3 N-terminal domain-containing protein [Solirubrobacteraceae bacterium]